MAKWDNMLSMLWMLRSGRKLTAAQIADSLEISVRTVYRYREARFLLDVPTMDKYLPKHLITFGTAIRVREPLELKRRIREMAYGIAKHYEGDPD